MPKKFIRRYLPDHQKVREHRVVAVFGKWLHEPNLWHLNRRSVSGAAAVGLFCAFLPVPLQMAFAAAGAILFRVNLPQSVVTVWLTNPLTMPPIFYFNYRVGEALLGLQHQPVDFEVSASWLMQELAQIWLPLLVGSLTMGCLLAVTGFVAVRGLWRLHVISHYKKRRHRRHSGSASRVDGPRAGAAAARGVIDLDDAGNPGGERPGSGSAGRD